MVIFAVLLIKNKYNMELKVEATDYISESEIKEIVKEEVRSQVGYSVREMFKKEDDIRRILCNTAYTAIEMEVEKLIPDYKETIASDVKAVIDKHDLKYEVYHESMGFGNESLGTQIIHKVIKDNSDVITGKVEKLIKEYDVKELVEKTFKGKIREFADSFGSVADMLYELGNDDNK